MMKNWKLASEAENDVRMIGFHPSWGRPHFVEKINGEWRVEWTDGVDAGPTFAEDPEYVTESPELP